jgi:hypothetical protein
MNMSRSVSNRFVSPIVATLHQADGSQQFQHQRLRPQRLVNETQCDAVDGFAVLDDHVEAVLVVHDGTKAHNPDVNVISGAAQFELLNVPRPPLCTRTAQHIVELRSIGRDHRQPIVRRTVRVVVDVGAAVVQLLTGNSLLRILHIVLNMLLIPHHLQPKTEVIDQRFQALVLVIEKFLHPLDVIRSERNLQIPQNLRRRRFTHNLAFLERGGGK